MLSPMNPRRLFPAVVCTFAIISMPLRAVELPGAGALAEIILKRFDTNDDSKMDMGEWQAGVTGSFGEMDLDGDGKITGAELDSVGEALTKESGEAAGALLAKLIKALVLTMDADKDGSVSLREYRKVADALFAKLDTNKDAEVTRDELLTLPLKMLAPGGK